LRERNKENFRREKEMNKFSCLAEETFSALIPVPTLVNSLNPKPRDTLCSLQVGGEHLGRIVGPVIRTSAFLLAIGINLLSLIAQCCLFRMILEYNSQHEIMILLKAGGNDLSLIIKLLCRI
jgi:hypothetical protein